MDSLVALEVLNAPAFWHSEGGMKAEDTGVRAATIAKVENLMVSRQVCILKSSFARLSSVANARKNKKSNAHFCKPTC
jgi:hypothetical protein